MYVNWYGRSVTVPEKTEVVITHSLSPLEGSYDHLHTYVPPHTTHEPLHNCHTECLPISPTHARTHARTHAHTHTHTHTHSTNLSLIGHPLSATVHQTQPAPTTLPPSHHRLFWSPEESVKGRKYRIQHWHTRNSTYSHTTSDRAASLLPGGTTIWLATENSTSQSVQPCFSALS